MTTWIGIWEQVFGWPENLRWDAQERKWAEIYGVNSIGMNR